MSITRRRFVHVAARLAVTSAVARRTFAANPPPALSLGYSLYGMKMVPLGESLALCARIGYRNVELCLFPGYPAEPMTFSAAARDETRQQLKKLGLSVSSLMVATNITGNDRQQAQNVETIQAAAAMAHDVQPDRPPPIQVQFGAGKPEQWETLKQQTAERLRELTAAAAAGRTSIVLGSHAGAMVNLPDRLLWLYEQAKSPALALYYNHIHSSLEGVPLEESWRMLGSMSKFIHLQDATGDGRNKNYLLPGDGPTDYPKYFRLLKDSGYRGPVVVHVSGKFSTVPGYKPIEVAEKCHAAMAHALKQAGAA